MIASNSGYRSRRQDSIYACEYLALRHAQAPSSVAFSHSVQAPAGYAGFADAVIDKPYLLAAVPSRSNHEN
jgi:hypothetical protein